MADLQLRFNLDMLVLSTPILPQLERLGIDSARDNELTLLLEPEVLDEIYMLEAAAGAQCLVADTASMTPARLAHARLGARAEEIASAAVEAARKHQPQHVLVEIGPCGLPLDASSKGSLVENRDQYARGAGYFAAIEPLFDAYFLNGFTDCADLKCALMGIRKVTDKPLLASVDLDSDGFLDSVKREPFSAAVEVMAEYGAQVAGFTTFADPLRAGALAREAHAINPVMPVLAQLGVKDIYPEQNAPTAENPYYEPDTMIDAADTLRNAGVQFLRASGNATPAFTGALAASTLGDVVEAPDVVSASRARADNLDDLAETLRLRINDALGN